MKRINISFYVLVISALTVSMVITTLLYKASPLFTSKTLFLCQKFISNIMIAIPRSLPNTLILVIGLVLGTGFLSFLIQLIKTHVFLRKLLIRRTNMSSRLAKVSESINLTNQTSLSLRDKLILVKDRNLFSFCCGIFSPFIVVSTGLVESLTNKELEAVLLHEQSHLMSRDPIKVLIGKTFSSMFFFLPIFRELYRNIEAANESLADQWTINYQENSAFLRGALKKILAAPQLNLATVSNVSGPDYCEATSLSYCEATSLSYCEATSLSYCEATSLSYFEIRIHRLINPGTKYKFRLSKSSLLTTFLFVIVSWFLLQTPVSAFHMDSMDDSAYHEGTSFAYFLCSADQSCSEQCHTNIKQPTNYVPTYLILPERKCDNHSQDVNKPLLNSKSSRNQILLNTSDREYQAVLTSEVSEYQAPLFNH